VLGIERQSEDPPFPLACRVLRYLEFVMMRVDKMMVGSTNESGLEASRLDFPSGMNCIDLPTLRDG
jgi:hypothetical protein